MFKIFNKLYKEKFMMQYETQNFKMSPYIEKILDNIAPDDKPSVLIYPGGEELNTFFIPYISLYGRYINLIGDGKDITDDLKVDELVFYKTGLGKFKGKKTYKNWGVDIDGLRHEIAVKIEVKDGSQFVTEKDFFRITRYNGDATRLNNLNKQKNNKKVNQLISSFELSNDSVSSLISKSILYVKNKNDLDKIVSNTTITFGIINAEPLNRIVPLTYWSSCDRNVNYSGNRLGLKPVINVTSSLENALELLYEKDEIEIVVVDLSDFRGIDYNIIEQIFDFERLKHKIILLPLEEYYQFNTYFKSIEMNNIFMDYDISEALLINRNTNPIQKLQITLLENYKNHTMTFKTIDNNENFNFRGIKKSLKLLIDNGNNDENTRDILSRTSHLLSLLKSYIGFDAIIKSHESKSYIDQIFKEIESDVSLILKNDDFYSIEQLSKILEDLRCLISNVIYSNMLAKEIKKIVKYSSDFKILFVVQNNRVKEIVESYIRSRFKSNNIHCKTISKIDTNYSYDSIYILSVIPNLEKATSKLFSLFNAHNIVFIYYESYLNYIKYLSRKYSSQLFFEKQTKNLMNRNIGDRSCDLERQDYDLIRELIQISNTYHIGDILRIYFGSTSEKSDAFCEYFIQFNGYYGVFKKDYKVYKINVQEKHLDYIKISELSIGDEILILNDEFKSGAFIEDVIEALLCDEDFNKRHGEMIDLSQRWKSVLKTYIYEHDMSGSELHRLLKNKGLKRTYTTFRNWINNDYIVGPDSEEDYKLIFSLQNVSYNYNWQDVYKACTYVRRLHVSLRADIGRLIVESYFDNKVISDSLKYLDTDFMDKVTIFEVSDVDNSGFKVPSYMVNSIKRKEE